MDYSTLLWMQQQPSWKDAINKCTYRGLKQGIEMEGMCGYISVDVELDIHDISTFAKLISSRFNDGVTQEIMDIRYRVLYEKHL